MTRLQLSVVTLLLCACGGASHRPPSPPAPPPWDAGLLPDGGGRCGDGVCEFSESCNTCVADCCPVSGEFDGGDAFIQGTTGAVDLQPGRLLGAMQPITASYRIGMTSDTTCEYQNPNTGGTGLVYMDSLNSPYVAGAGASIFNGSMACGQCYLLELQGRRAVVVVADACPTCAGFDLPQSASAALSGTGSPRNYNTGDGLTYAPVACDWQRHPLEYYFGPGSGTVSNPGWNWYLQILWSNYPVTNVTAYVQSSGKTLQLTHDSVGRFHVGSNAGTGQITFTLSALDAGTGEVVTDTVVWDGGVDTVVYGTGANFHL